MPLSLITDRALESYFGLDVARDLVTTINAGAGGGAGGVLYNVVSAPADGATITLDLSAANLFVPAALGGNRTLALSNSPTVSPWAKFTLVLTQGAGSNTVTWFSGISWPGGTVPTLSTGAGKRDIFSFIEVASGAYLGFIVGQNS